MNPTQEINKRVTVVAAYKDTSVTGKSCFPYRMIYNGQDIKFTELGLRHPTEQGRRMIHVFHMSDGTNGYRLEFDAERLIWTLLAMIPGDAA